MGLKNRAETERESRLSDALLFATMCIIGLPVDVHVKDGSVFSGIFHTASVDKDYGVVLKEARLSKKGKCSANVANESVIETLVILSGDLVQVVAKSVLLPGDGVAGGMAGDAVNAAATDSHSSDIVLREANKSTVDKNKFNQKRNSTKTKNGSIHSLMPTNVGKENGGSKLSINHGESPEEFKPVQTSVKREESSIMPVNKRQTGNDYSNGEQEPVRQNVEHQRAGEVLSSSSILDSNLAAINSFQEPQKTMKMLPNGVSRDSAFLHVKPENQHSGRPTSMATSTPNAVCSSIIGSGHLVDVASESHCNSLSASTEIVSPPSSESNKSLKEFKLNPGAKIFFPSYTNSTSVTPPPAPVVTSVASLPPNSHLGVPAAQPEVGVGFAPRSAVPAKFLPYNNLATGNGGSASHFPQPVIGHVGSRTQPFRYASQYHAVQAGQPAYVHPSSPAVMVGRTGQIVYVQPVPQDLVQSTATIIPVPARPLLPLHQVPFPKHEGTVTAQTLHMCLPPPFPDVQQPFAMTTHVPLLQPGIPVNRPIPVPGSSFLYSSKFP